MKKILFIIVFVLLHHDILIAQQTSLTINCPKAGWLADLINTQDKLLVEDLTITGELNAKDMDYIVRLASEYSLKHLDLTHVGFVASSFVLPATGRQNYYEDNYFPMVGNLTLRYIAFPISMKGFQDTPYTNKPYSIVSDSTIIGGGDKEWRNPFLQTPEYLEIREGVEEIYGPDSKYWIHNTKKVQLPQSLKVLGNYVFFGSPYGTTEQNIETLDINFPDNLEILSAYSINGFQIKQDTVRVPKSMTTFYTRAFVMRDSMVFYFHDKVKCIDERKGDFPGLSLNEGFNGKEIVMHIDNVVPPTYYPQAYNYTYHYNYIVYVPKGSIDAYRKATYWQDMDLREEPVKVNSVCLDRHELHLKKGDEYTLNASVYPSNADDSEIIWTSYDNNVASVNRNGVVRAIGSGSTYIYAISNNDSRVMDSCFVEVAQPVTGIKLNVKSVTLNYIGETDQLYATIMPENATNRNVRWQSTNESVCIVSGNGMIVATGYGTAVVIASTEEGGFMAVCTVTVEDADAIKEIKISDKPVNVYSPQGIFIKTIKTQNDINTLQPGVYIINHQKFIKR